MVVKKKKHKKGQKMRTKKQKMKRLLPSTKDFLVMMKW